MFITGNSWIHSLLSFTRNLWSSCIGTITSPFCYTAGIPMSLTLQVAFSSSKWTTVSIRSCIFTTSSWPLRFVLLGPWWSQYFKYLKCLSALPSQFWISSMLDPTSVPSRTATIWQPLVCTGVTFSSSYNSSSVDISSNHPKRKQGRRKLEHRHIHTYIALQNKSPFFPSPIKLYHVLKNTLTHCNHIHTWSLINTSQSISIKSTNVSTNLIY